MTATIPDTRYLFFTGKGGVGKTSLSCATAIALADRGERVLLISTDPASNLDQVLGVDLGPSPRPVPGVPGLSALNIDPEAAAAAYRERALGPLRGAVDAAELSRREEELSGACTVEIAAFDEFTGYLARGRESGGEDLDRYGRIVFDTAPTGHTLRLLTLPAAWTDYMTDNPLGSSCLGPHTALQQQQEQYREAIAALGDPGQTTLILVTRPERSAIEEAARTASELREMGMNSQRLAINGRFTATDRTDPIALAMEARGAAALAAMPPALAALPAQTIPLRPFSLVGVDNLRRLFDDSPPVLPAAASAPADPGVPPLSALVDDIERDGRGLVLVMGKGGVGKTTIAAAVACELAARGHRVLLTTTDPAAHIAATVEGSLPNLSVSRIDPAAEVAAYTERVVAARGRDLDEEGLDLLREDLRSPCTEEVAVFHAFSRAISQARTGFVVVDTAPTGHTLLLLDTTGAYHHEIMRSLEKQSRASNAVTPLLRLRDPAYTKMLIVALPEATPVQEARQ
ncbi:MAG: arsenical pump-driving ATPase, partial [Thermomicrobiales bacterium]